MELQILFCTNNQSYLLYYWEVMDKHDLLRNSFQRLNEEIASVDGTSSVPSAIKSYSSEKESTSSKKNAKNWDNFAFCIQNLATKNLQAASMAAEEAKKDREQRKEAIMMDMEEKRLDRQQRKEAAQEEQAFKVKAELKSEGMAAYFRTEVEQIEIRERQLNDQLEELNNSTTARQSQLGCNLRIVCKKKF